MSQNLIQHVCMVGVAVLLEGVRINFKPGDVLPADLRLPLLDEIVGMGAVEKRIAPVPDAFESEAAGSNEAGAAGDAIPGTHTPPVSEGEEAAAEAAAAPATQAAVATPLAPARNRADRLTT